MLLAAALLALGLGVEPFLAAFGAGIAVARVDGAKPDAVRAQTTLRNFSFAFFVPVYFALVGANLNLRHNFNVAFFIGFFVAACALKAVSVYFASRITGRTRQGSLDLAVALNARGGPGIVLASVAFSAHIVSQNYYAMLVLLAILTSMLAGSYLAQRPKEAFVGDAFDAQMNDTDSPDTDTPVTARPTTTVPAPESV